MNFFKKSLLFITILFLCASIYNDMTVGSIPTEEPSVTKQIRQINENIIKVQVLPGDNVLSIVENYNQSASLDVEQITEDFIKLNPTADPYNLKVYKYYYFPVYHAKK